MNPLTSATAAVALQGHFTAVVVWALAGLVLVGSGCQVGPRNFENENDKLRRENMQLRQQVEQLEASVERRTGELRALRTKYEARPSQIPGAEPPVLSQINLGRYTAIVDSNNDDRDDLVRAYVDTLDQDGAFLPTAGRAVLQAAVIEENQPPFLIAQKTFDAAAWRSAYRSTWLGTHYTLEAPITQSIPDDVQQITIKVDFTDAATGATFTAQQAVPVNP